MNSMGNLDILNCLANLSSDEVFTSPELANKMLDLLPQDLFKNPNTTFLDPGSKSGVFLREIAKRLIKGLKEVFPNEQDRIDHIMAKQLFALSITQLTAEISRRTLYCSRDATGKFSITNAFKKSKNKSGNIKYENLKHSFNKKGICIFCDASIKEYLRSDSSSIIELENHAYEFIHKKNFKEIFNMKFDVIIGNPPYHLSDGGGGLGTSAKPIYDKFVATSIKLQPNYLCMIIPARWYTGGRDLNNFRDMMLKETRIKKLFDFENSADCFSTLGDRSIKGGICYFLWDKNWNGKCEIHSFIENKEFISIRFLKEKTLDVFVRDLKGIDILNKINLVDKTKISNIISSQRPFGMRSNFSNFFIKKLMKIN